MVTGKSYRDVKRAFLVDFTQEGLRHEQLDWYLAEHGYAVARRYVGYNNLVCKRPTRPFKPFADVLICSVATVSRLHWVELLLEPVLFDED
jgi:hypothetical protein